MSNEGVYAMENRGFRNDFSRIMTFKTPRKRIELTKLTRE